MIVQSCVDKGCGDTEMAERVHFKMVYDFLDGGPDSPVCFVLPAASPVKALINNAPCLTLERAKAAVKAHPFLLTKEQADKTWCFTNQDDFTKCVYRVPVSAEAAARDRVKAVRRLRTKGVTYEQFLKDEYESSSSFQFWEHKPGTPAVPMICEHGLQAADLAVEQAHFKELFELSDVEFDALQQQHKRPRTDGGDANEDEDDEDDEDDDFDDEDDDDDDGAPSGSAGGDDDE